MPKKIKLSDWNDVATMKYFSEWNDVATMKYKEVKPLPEGVWKAQHTRFDRPVCHPRGVENYRLQEVADGCWNCDNRYCGMFDLGGKPKLACKFACRDPESPSYCDEVNHFGICDRWAGESKNEQT